VTRSALARAPADITHGRAARGEEGKKIIDEINATEDETKAREERNDRRRRLCLSAQSQYFHPISHLRNAARQGNAANIFIRTLLEYFNANGRTESRAALFLRLLFTDLRTQCVWRHRGNLSPATTADAHMARGYCSLSGILLHSQHL
jgi:hypothetical protein